MAIKARPARRNIDDRIFIPVFIERSTNKILISPIAYVHELYTRRFPIGHVPSEIYDIYIPRLAAARIGDETRVLDWTEIASNQRIRATVEKVITTKLNTGFLEKHNSINEWTYQHNEQEHEYYVVIASVCPHKTYITLDLMLEDDVWKWDNATEIISSNPYTDDGDAEIEFGITYLHCHTEKNIFDGVNKLVIYHNKLIIERIKQTGIPTMAKKSKPEVKTLQDILPETELRKVAFIHASVSAKPDRLIIPDNKWKFMVRTALRGKNLLFTGPAGCGKTFAAYSVANAMNRPYFYFNLGATQDPRSTLIGNMHFTEGTGTDFIPSEFIRAIQTPNAVILLDELSRAHPEAWNILMTALDVNQRYVRVDESRDSENNIINVHETVSFFATANIGMEYTSTRVLDRAITDRFQILEMDYLNKDEQYELLKRAVPTLLEFDESLAEDICSIYDTCIKEARSGSGKISTAISTRVLIELCEVITDGFTLADAAELCIYPYFPDDGGADSERTYVKQVVQKYIKTNTEDRLFSK